MKKQPPVQDPHAEREARTYTNPIPSREVILTLLDQCKGPRNREEIAELLGLTGDEELEALRRRLIAMARDGQIISNRKGSFGRIDKMNVIRGRVQGHRDGYGFVISPDVGEDVYLSNRQMRRVFDGDEVLVRLDGRGGFRGRKEGAIVEILERNTTQIVGRYRFERGVHFVKADNPRIVQDIMIAPDHTLGASPGQLVTVDIVAYPVRDTPAIGHIAEVLGDHLAPGMEIDVAIRSHGIPHVWPQEVVEQAERLKPEVEEADKKARVDLRQLPLVTIDGEDARDFDDAVYCEAKKSGGWRLYVAIADVSHYVQAGAALDVEAFNRGNSVYFPDFVVPMLPEQLSNGLCSLNPQVDRLCMVCEMTISAAGRVSGFKFYEAVMHSHARLTYTQVGQVLAERGDKRSGIRKHLHSVAKQLDTLHDLYKVLRAERSERGAIDFETQETRILFNEQRKIEQIVPVQRNDAHKLIEECMLAANVCAAKFLEQLKVPAVYRVHEGPKEKKLELLREYLAGLGLGLRTRGQVTPQDYQEVLQSVEGRADAHLIQTMLLRSMEKAVYQPNNKGHFGLAYSGYTHFTSPIRRYPDLLVHRAIRHVIRSNIETNKVKRHPDAKSIPKEVIYPYGLDEMLVFGEQCSLSERRADDATRDVISWLKCEYLQDRVGDVFEGVISATTSFGLFVELKDIYIEGLVHITALPQDYYHHEPAKNRLIGERSRRVFSMGDELTVRVVAVNLDERKIDFEVEQAKPRRRKKGAGGGKGDTKAEYQSKSKPKSKSGGEPVLESRGGEPVLESQGGEARADDDSIKRQKTNSAKLNAKRAASIKKRKSNAPSTKKPLTVKKPKKSVKSKAKKRKK